MRILHGVLMAASAAMLATSATVRADNGLYPGTGGSFATGTATGTTVAVQTVPLTGTKATVSASCPVTSFGEGTYQWNWQCAGGSVSVTSSDGSLTLHASLLSGIMTYSGSAGGRGSHGGYTYQFTGLFSGRLQMGSVSQGVNGSLKFAVQTSGSIGTAAVPVTSLSLGWSSAYTPIVVADSANARLLGADSLSGANLVSYGARGSGTAEFETISGLARDAQGAIYIVDSTLDRLVRIEGLGGTNWAELGSYGTGSMHFNRPLGVAVDSSGRIWVADAGNNRIVRVDNISGANWISFGSAGTGAKQFNSPAAIALDSTGRLYVADSGNNRIVRCDDIAGTNWTTLSSIAVSPYAYPLTGVNHVVVARSGKIYMSLPGGWIYRADNMTGANGQTSQWSPSVAGLSLDSSDTLLVAGSFGSGLLAMLDGAGNGMFPGSLGQAQLVPGAVLAGLTSSPPPAAPVLSAKSLAFASRNVGEPGAAQQVSLANIGGEPLTISSIAASSDYKLTNNCPRPLPGGTSCTISVQLDPVATGSRSATLSIDSNGIHPTMEVALSGVGTRPVPVLLPGSLVFAAQKTATVSTAQILTLSNTGTGPLTISSSGVAGDFLQTNNCSAVLSPGNGCTIQVSFKPAISGTRTGALTIRDDAVATGASQTVALSGTGATTAPAISLNPESLLFPEQQVSAVSTAQTITLSNRSAAKISLSAPTVTAGFRSTTSCSGTLAAGASCTVSVQYAPAAAGTTTGKLTVGISGSASLTASLAGTGVTSAHPMVGVSPTALTFGTVQTGDNPTLTLTLTNSTGLPAGIRFIALTGSPAFAVKGNTCTSLLAGDAACSVRVMFNPGSAGSYSAGITVTESSGARTVIPVSGDATASNN